MSNFATLLNHYLEPKGLHLLEQVSRAGVKLGFDTYLVGGAVRDIYIGQPPDDLDIVVEGGDDTGSMALADKLGAETIAESQFGTGRYKVNGIAFDIAMSRVEIYKRPGALPIVAPAKIGIDLTRRDFTINAVAVCLSKHVWGEVIDPFNGLEDIEKKIIRVLNEQSFRNDPTRIFRAVRYAGRLGFEFEKSTLNQLLRNLKNIDTISGERATHEIYQIFSEIKAVEILKLAENLGVLRAVHSDLGFSRVLLDKIAGAEIRPTNNDVLLALALFEEKTLDSTDVISKLKIDSTSAKVLVDLEITKTIIERHGDSEMNPSKIHWLLKDLSTESIEAAAFATDNLRIKQYFELYLNELRHVKPLLDGEDLIALGVQEGPHIGEIIHALLDARLDGQVFSRKDEETRVLQFLNE